MVGIVARIEMGDHDLPELVFEAGAKRHACLGDLGIAIPEVPRRIRAHRLAAAGVLVGEGTAVTASGRVAGHLLRDGEPFLLDVRFREMNAAALSSGEALPTSEQLMCRIPRIGRIRSRPNLKPGRSGRSSLCPAPLGRRNFEHGTDIDSVRAECLADGGRETLAIPLHLDQEPRIRHCRAPRRISLEPGFCGPGRPMPSTSRTPLRSACRLCGCGSAAATPERSMAGEELMPVPMPTLAVQVTAGRKTVGPGVVSCRRRVEVTMGVAFSRSSMRIECFFA